MTRPVQGDPVWANLDLEALLEFACQSTNTHRIRAARSEFQRRSSEDVLAMIGERADKILDLNDDWDYRRLLELLRDLDDMPLLKRFVVRGLEHTNADIAEAAEDAAGWIRAREIEAGPARTRVVNIRHEAYDVYIGRSGKGLDGPLGNPYSVAEHGVSALGLYRRYFYDRVQKDPAFRELVLSCRGKRLGCFCKGPPGRPREDKPCHGDVIVEWLEKNEKQS